MLTKEYTLKDLFPEMPESSKVWIYQANRRLTEQEITLIREKGNDFVLNWESHGSKLKAGFAVLFDLFLVFSVDENQHGASGCSIDKSVHFVKEVQNMTGINFFDRTKVAYLDSEDTVQLISLSEITGGRKKDNINNKTLIFNNLINNLNEVHSCWIIQAGNSWLSKFL
jgi:hypothetical protein